jgi:phosphoglycolate phosphatase-like HAD superfamily hydrolase
MTPPVTQPDELLQPRRWLALALVALLASCTARTPPPGSAASRDGGAPASAAESLPAQAARPAAAADPLPSWNAGAAKDAIVAFVARVTREGGPDFVPAPERIATFDNDGTLWSEQPVYVQFAFALDRVRDLAPQHPEWRSREPFKSVLAGDAKAALAGGEHAIVELLAATHAGNTTDEFDAIVRQWISTAHHPRFGKPYTQVVYQPMLELLAYLRANGFKTFIVSGGGVDFMRPWAEDVYGIPPEQIVGSRAKLEYRDSGGEPRIERLASVDLVDDKAGKPVGIQQQIGRRPIAAFGNSDGDFEMLEWTTSGPGPRLGVLVHHTDATREWAYDRDSQVGMLARALDEAPKRGWIVVDMKRDWRTVFAFEQ